VIGMVVRSINDIDRLKKINAALISRVERSMDQQGNAFSLFQTAINLENRVRSRTEELRATLRRLEESNLDLVEAKEAAELANLSKTRFLAAASHDVLQPLNAAHLSISALADIQTTDEGHKLVRQVERSLETMDDLLRTLLDIAKLDAGVVSPDIAEVSLEALFSSLASDFQPLATRKRLKLRFHSGGLAAWSDRTMLRRILQNIISNAIRYTRSGGVLVGARRRGAIVRIDVCDTGCGIPADQHLAVFEEFHRGPVAHDTEMSGGGLGLGLSIVRRMAGALRHPIRFTSIVGRGTCFSLELPIGSLGRIEQGMSVAEADHPRGYGLFGTKVLLVENDTGVLLAMSGLLQSWQCTVRTASTREAALLAMADGRWQPDVIIADQHLDGGDLGTQTIDQVRELTARAVPALIITGDASTLLAQTARAQGIELMRKPVKPAQLRALLAHLLA